LDVLASGYDERNVRNTGIEFLGFYYNAPELRDIRIRAKGNPTVQIRYDAGDVGTIHVLDERDGRYIKAYCSAQEVHGRSLWQAKCILKTWHMQKAISDDLELRDSEESLREYISTKASKKTNLYKGKSRHARFLAKPSTPTGLVEQNPLSLLGSSSENSPPVTPCATQTPPTLEVWPSLTNLDRDRLDPILPTEDAPPYSPLAKKEKATKPPS